MSFLAEHLGLGGACSRSDLGPLWTCLRLLTVHSRGTGLQPNRVDGRRGTGSPANYLTPGPRQPPTIAPIPRRWRARLLFKCNFHITMAWLPRDDMKGNRGAWTVVPPADSAGMGRGSGVTPSPSGLRSSTRSINRELSPHRWTGGLARSTSARAVGGRAPLSRSLPKTAHRHVGLSRPRSAKLRPRPHGRPLKPAGCKNAINEHVADEVDAMALPPAREKRASPQDRPPAHTPDKGPRSAGEAWAARAKFSRGVARTTAAEGGPPSSEYGSHRSEAPAPGT